MPKPHITLSIERTLEIIARVFTNPIFSNMHELEKSAQSVTIFALQ